MRARAPDSLAWLALLVAMVAAGGVVTWALGAMSMRVREMAVAALSAALGRELSIGHVSGAPWQGIVLEEINIPASRPGDPPPLTARRATVYVDLGMLARDLTHRRGIIRSITQVVVDEPVLRITRSPAGSWNFNELFPRGAGSSTSSAFGGRIVILDGVVTWEDRHRVRPRTFTARFADLNGTADFSRTPRVALRASYVEDRDARQVASRLTGVYMLDSRMLDVDLKASGADLGAWGPYLLTTPAFRISGGQADATLHMLRTPAGLLSITDFSGRLVVRNGRASFPGRPAALSGVQGEIRFSNQSLSTQELRGFLNGSRLTVRGDASFYGEPRLDLVARSDAADLRTLGRLFFPRLVSRISGVVRGEVRIIGPISAPRLQGRIEAASGVIDHQPFENASGDIAFYGQMLSLSGARGAVAGAQLSGGGSWTVGPAPEYFVSLQFDGADAASVNQWMPAVLPAFDGRLRGSLTAVGRGATRSVAGQASLSGGRVRGVPIDALDASFRSDPTGIAVEHVLVRQGSTWASGTGRVDARGGLSLEATGATAELASLPSFPARIAAAGSADFLGRLRGTIRAPEMIGSVQVYRGRFGGLAFDTASGRLVLRPGQAELEGVRARSGFARYRASGQIDWNGEAALDLDVEAERASAATLAKVAGLPVEITGRVDGRMRLQGPLAQPSAAGSLLLRDAEVFGQAVDEAAAAFRWDGRRLTLEGSSIRRHESVIHFAGTFDRLAGLALDVSTRGFDLRDLTLRSIGPTRFSGTVDLTGRITGRPASPMLAVDATSSNLTVNGLRFDRASGAIRWQAGTLRLDPLELRLGAERYEIAGDVALSGAPRVSLSARVGDGRLSTLFGLAGTRLGLPLDGTVSGTATLDGPLSNPAARLDLRLSAGRWGDLPLEGHADLTLRNGSVTIEDLELRPQQGRIAATGRFDLRGESQIEISGSDLNLDVLRPALRLRQPLVGGLNFTIQMGGTLAAPELGFDLEVTKGGIEGATFDSLVASGFYRDGVLQLSQALLVQSGHKLRAAGTLPFNPALLRFDDRAPLNLHLTLADVNLGLLRLFTDRVEEARGAVEGTVQINGTAAAPRLNGHVRIGDGLLRLRGLQTPLESLRLDLRFDESAVRVAEGTARVGGGSVRLEGAMRLVLGAAPAVSLVVPADASLVLQGTNVRIGIPPLVDAQFDGSVRVWGALGDPRRPPTLDGRVAVSDGTIMLASVPGGPAPSWPLVFQGLRFDAGPDLFVQVGGLRVGLEPGGSLLLTGTLRAPMLEGTVEARRGAVVALGNSFDLEEGKATFYPAFGLRPAVSALAVTQVGSLRITLAIRGTAPDALTLDLRSDPPLPESEIVALLGRQAGISQLLSGDAQGLLRAELSRRLFAPVSLAIARALGLSELAIEYDFERPLRLRAGRALLRNLYLTATTTFEARTRVLWALEYRFAPGWQFAFRVDSDGQREAIFWYTTRF
ncbi:MAG: translocation/assembly module TamB domain-containing protein [Armatimonadota bacterium]